MLQIEMLPVDRLVPYIRNARTHSDDQIAQIAASMAEFGFTNPILIGEDEVIIAGHGRLMAAKALGLTEVPVIVLDHLTEAQRRALVIADIGLGLDRRRSTKQDVLTPSRNFPCKSKKFIV